MATWQDLVKFIQCVSRTHLTQNEVDHVFRFVKKDVPWDHLVVLAGMQGVDGFVYCHMNHLGLLNILPKSVLGQLEGGYAQTRKHTIAILNEAEALSPRLEKARIPVIALQGLSLINTLYRDPGLRQLGDIDLMVKPDDKKRLKELLCQAGYWSPYPTYPDLLFKADVLIDIHTHVLNLERIKNRRYLFPEDLTPMWKKATPLFNQVTTPTLPSPFKGEGLGGDEKRNFLNNEHSGLLILEPFDNFVALTAHALKHSYSRLIWLVDLHEFLIKWADNTNGWEEMVKRARFWHQERVVLYALILVEKIFDLKIPYRVKRALGIHQLNPLEKHLLRLSLRGFASDELCIALWLCNIKGLGEKLKFIKETIFPKDEIMAQIFDKSSQTTKASVYAKRMGNALTMMGKGLQQALRFSFRSAGNK